MLTLMQLHFFVSVQSDLLMEDLYVIRRAVLTAHHRDLTNDEYDDDNLQTATYVVLRTNNHPLMFHAQLLPSGAVCTHVHK